MKVDIGIFDFSQVHSYGSELGYLPPVPDFSTKNMDLELTGYARGKGHFLPDFCHIE